MTERHKEFLFIAILQSMYYIPTDRDTSKFNSCLETFGMEQHVRGPTHVAGHTLDVIITRDTDTIVSNKEVNDPGLSDSDGKISRDHLICFSAFAFKFSLQMFGFV
jgi:hypothetical protein